MKDRLVEAAARAIASGPNPSSDTYVLATAAVEAVLREMRVVPFEVQKAFEDEAGACFFDAGWDAAISTVMGEG